jgi:hypothetical protein
LQSLGRRGIIFSFKSAALLISVEALNPELASSSVRRRFDGGLSDIFRELVTSDEELLAE